MTSAGGWARLVKLGSSCEILLFSVAALHKSLTQDETPLAGIWENMVLEVDISPLSSCVQDLILIRILKTMLPPTSSQGLCAGSGCS